MSRKKNIQLLLTENVDNLGIVGDVVDVKPGYARNYLLPLGLADVPTEGNKKRVEERRAEVEKQLRELRLEQEKLIGRLEGTEITLQRSHNEDGNLYGSVTQRDIADALKEDGFNVTERDVRIGSPIRQLDSYDIPIQLDNDLKTEIKLWVVSDKPAEQLEAERKEREEREAAEAKVAQERRDRRRFDDPEIDILND